MGSPRAMTYDSGVASSSQYQTWIAGQTTRILRAVSGGAWSLDGKHVRLDGKHVPPRNELKVLIGLPGFYTATNAHNLEFENAASGALGVRTALSSLKRDDPKSLN